jgi:adenylate cyclase
LVTAVFCDLVGFTPISEAMDPEEIRDIQAAYFEQMSVQIERYGGTVEKYAGDAVLALFGVPVAHEDDAERAVLCALGMQAAIDSVAAGAGARWAEAEPAIRVGVNTGEVVSGTWNASGRQDVAVTGDALNSASRIQGVAEPGEVLVGTETMRLTRRRIRFGERRDVLLKGKAGNVPVYPALGVREQFGERWEMSQLATPLIGRDRELASLLDAWDRAQAGEGQIVTIIGDAGVGKSRLMAEFLDSAGGGAVRVVRGRCLSYGQEISLWLIADVLRGLFGISEQDVAEVVADKLRSGLSALLARADAETQAEAIDVIGEVLGLPAAHSVVEKAGAQIRRQSLLRSLRQVMSAVSERAPALLVLEDLHWIDEASADVLTEVLSDVPGLRMLVLAAQRPGWTAPWSQWGWTERIALRPLGEADATMLAGSVLGGKSLSAELEQHVAERAGGNPFFVEEMVRALDETGGLEQRDGSMHLVPGAAERLPSTLTEVLLARLDRLDGPVRTVAQVASVIGRSFATGLLARVMDAEPGTLDSPLTLLQQAEIAFPRQGGSQEYTFKHVSMREVAYNTLVQRRRQQLHLDTARAIAGLYPSDEYVEMIAYHYSRTDEHAEAAIWLERAGDRAADVYALETAMGHYRETAHRLERSGAPPLDIAGVQEKLGGALLTAGRYDEALSKFHSAVAEYEKEHDLESAGRITAKVGVLHRYRGTPDEGLALVQPMIERLDWSGPSETLTALYLARTQLLFYTGRYREMLDAAERAAELARSIGNDRLLGEAEERRGTAFTMVGRSREARVIIENALPLVEAGGDLLSLWRALNNAGEASKITGDIERARQYLERGVGLTERVGNPGLMAFILANLGHVLMIQGDMAGAREALERAEGLSRSSGTSSADISSCLEYLGMFHMMLGDRVSASRYLREALALAESSGDRQAQENASADLAHIDIQEGRAEVARARLEPLAARQDAELGILLPVLTWAYLELDEEKLARDTADRAVEHTRVQEPMKSIDALRAQAMVFDRYGEGEKAERAIEEGLNLARSLPYPYAEARLLQVLASVLRKQGDEEAARETFRRALAIFRRLGTQGEVEEVEQALQQPV